MNRSRRGVAAIEYVLLAALVGIVAILAMQGAGESASENFFEVATRVDEVIN